MSEPVLLLTAGVEIGLAAGYGLCWVRGWVVDVRRMVAGFAQAMGRPTTTKGAP